MSIDSSSSPSYTGSYDSYEQSESEEDYYYGVPSIPKRRRTSLSSNGQDKISTLPDSLLYKILSFLNVQEVIATSFLSKRWMPLWKTHPYLNFSHYLWKSRRGTNRFAGFVDNFLLLREDRDIERFHLSCTRSCDYFDQILNWIRVAIKRQVKEVVLDFDSLPFNVLPRFIFTSEISVFKLNYHGNKKREGIQLPGSMCMAPELKTLKLTCATLPQSNSNREVVMSCPMLENLCLSYCVLDNIDILNISAPQLVNLVIETEDKSRCKIKLCTPKLVSLLLKGSPHRDYSLHCLFSLVKARLQFSHGGVHPKLLNNIFISLNNATTIELSGQSSREVRSRDMPPDELWPIFYNLKCLGITEWSGVSCNRPICNLLRNSPYIETLVLGINQIYKEDWGKLFPCIDRLKSLEIWGIEGCEDELKFIEFVLKFAIVLENIAVRTLRASSGHREKKLEMFGNQMLSLPTASARVKILFMLRA
ncbi:hypothetical protein IFM89_010002 [Coptis chinensis]|uniref:F-box domain-containing protein n=1 Tax=Coptis chinensis TaxID=261450 RepID=A0A835HX46_9MAGN|nr:hypothetical protein IFM89_010002 [Coptis chinensis]